MYVPELLYKNKKQIFVHVRAFILGGFMGLCAVARLPYIWIWYPCLMALIVLNNDKKRSFWIQNPLNCALVVLIYSLIGISLIQLIMHFVQ